MANPGEIRRFGNGRSLVVLSWWNEAQGDEGTHYVCALLAEHKDPFCELEMRMPGCLNAVQAWNFMSLNERLLDSGELVTAIDESLRKAISEVVFSTITEHKLSDATKQLVGAPVTDSEQKHILHLYMIEEQKAFTWIELQDKFWQDFHGVVPIRKYRKHARKKVRTKPHIRHRRWEDDD